VSSRGLDPVEKNELEAITNYLNKVPTPTDKRITPSDLKGALGTGINIFSDTTKQ
jgi:hypothetical protein